MGLSTTDPLTGLMNRRAFQMAPYWAGTEAMNLLYI